MIRKSTCQYYEVRPAKKKLHPSTRPKADYFAQPPETKRNRTTEQKWNPRTNYIRQREGQSQEGSADECGNGGNEAGGNDRLASAARRRGRTSGCRGRGGHRLGRACSSRGSRAKFPSWWQRWHAVDVPPMGAVDWPLISTYSVELNVPVIPVKLTEKTASARIDTKEGNLCT